MAPRRDRRRGVRFLVALDLWGVTMGLLIDGPMADWRRIGDTDLEGCVYRGLVWLRGPCGVQHCMSLDAARQLGLWLHARDVCLPSIRRIDFMTQLPPYITIDADGRISRSSAPKLGRPKRAGQLKLTAFVVLMALFVVLYLEAGVSVLRLIF